MTFVPGKSGNPLGRPKRRDSQSEDLQAFYKKHQRMINEVGKIALKKAVEDEEPWAIKLCMAYFYPKPEAHVAISKEENTEINLTLTSLTQNLSLEDQQTFLRLWMKSKRGIPAFGGQVDQDEKVVEGEVLDGLQKA